MSDHSANPYTCPTRLPRRSLHASSDSPDHVHHNPRPRDLRSR